MQEHSHKFFLSHLNVHRVAGMLVFFQQHAHCIGLSRTSSGTPPCRNGSQTRQSDAKRQPANRVPHRAHPRHPMPSASHPRHGGRVLLSNPHHDNLNRLTTSTHVLINPIETTSTPVLSPVMPISIIPAARCCSPPYSPVPVTRATILDFVPGNRRL
jgi:hypothetical protein